MIETLHTPKRQYENTLLNPVRAKEKMETLGVAEELKRMADSDPRRAIQQYVEEQTNQITLNDESKSTQYCTDCDAVAKAYWEDWAKGKGNVDQSTEEDKYKLFYEEWKKGFQEYMKENPTFQAFIEKFAGESTDESDRVDKIYNAYRIPANYDHVFLKRLKDMYSDSDSMKLERQHIDTLAFFLYGPDAKGIVEQTEKKETEPTEQQKEEAGLLLGLMLHIPEETEQEMEDAATIEQVAQILQIQEEANTEDSNNAPIQLAQQNISKLKEARITLQDSKQINIKNESYTHIQLPLIRAVMKAKGDLNQEDLDRLATLQAPATPDSDEKEFWETVQRIRQAEGEESIASFTNKLNEQDNSASEGETKTVGQKLKELWNKIWTEREENEDDDENENTNGKGNMSPEVPDNKQLTDALKEAVQNNEVFLNEIQKKTKIRDACSKVTNGGVLVVDGERISVTHVVVVNNEIRYTKKSDNQVVTMGPDSVFLDILAIEDRNGNSLYNRDEMIFTNEEILKTLESGQLQSLSNLLPQGDYKQE